VGDVSGSVKRVTRLRELARQTIRLNRALGGMQPRAVCLCLVYLALRRPASSSAINHFLYKIYSAWWYVCFEYVSDPSFRWWAQAGVGRRRMASSSSQRAIRQITEQFDCPTEDLERGSIEVAFRCCACLVAAVPRFRSQKVR